MARRDITLQLLVLVRSTPAAVWRRGGSLFTWSLTAFVPKQVSFVQYSDEAKTEFRLNAYEDKGVAMASLHHIRYRGGNTKTGGVTSRRRRETLLQSFPDPVSLRRAGVALKHTYDKAFSVENGMRRNVPKVVVAITDGRSQDEVKKNAAKLQHAGRGGTKELLKSRSRKR